MWGVFVQGGLSGPGCLGRVGLEHRLEFLVLVWPCPSHTYPSFYTYVLLLSPDGGREAAKLTQLLQVLLC